MSVAEGPLSQVVPNQGNDGTFDEKYMDCSYVASSGDDSDEAEEVKEMAIESPIPTMPKETSIKSKLSKSIQSCRIAVVGDDDSGHQLLMRKIEFPDSDRRCQFRQCKRPTPRFFTLNTVCFKDVLDEMPVEVNMWDVSSCVMASSCSSPMQTKIHNWIREAHLIIMVFQKQKNSKSLTCLQKFAKAHKDLFNSSQSCIIINEEKKGKLKSEEAVEKPPTAIAMPIREQEEEDVAQLQISFPGRQGTVQLDLDQENAESLRARMLAFAHAIQEDAKIVASSEKHVEKKTPGKQSAQCTIL